MKDQNYKCFIHGIRIFVFACNSPHSTELKVFKSVWEGEVIANVYQKVPLKHFLSTFNK